MYRTASAIVREECFISGVGLDYLQEGIKTKTISAVRLKIIERLRKETTLSWREIALLVGRTKSYRGPKTLRKHSVLPEAELST